MPRGRARAAPRFGRYVPPLCGAMQRDLRYGSRAMSRNVLFWPQEHFRCAPASSAAARTEPRRFAATVEYSGHCAAATQPGLGTGITAFTITPPFTIGRPYPYCSFGAKRKESSPVVIAC